jgi:uncharacterized lipoprotein YddW (UPF0748 family)
MGSIGRFVSKLLLDVLLGACAAFILFFGWTVPVSAGEGKGKPFLGAYIHIDQVIDPKADIAANRQVIAGLLDQFKASGLRMVMPYATSTAGAAGYASTLIPVRTYSDWDPLEVFAAEARKRQLQFHPVVCVVSCGHRKPAGILLEHPEWALRGRSGEKMGYLSPFHPEARRWMVSVLKEIVTKFQPDGVVLDYLRFPNEPVQPDAESAARFEREYPSSQPSREADRRARLQVFKERNLTELARMISEELRRAEPDIRIGLYSWGPHVVKGHSVAQDWVTWAARGYVDMVSISGYCYRENYKDAYLHVFEKRMQDSMRMVRNATPSAELTFTLGVKTSHGQVRSAEEIDKYLRIAKRAGVEGVAIFTWSYLQPYLKDVVEKGYLRRFAAGS